MKTRTLVRICALLLALVSAAGLCACSNRPGISVDSGASSSPEGTVSGEPSDGSASGGAVTDPSVTPDPSNPSNPSDVNPASPSEDPSVSKEEPTPTPTPVEPTPTPTPTPVEPIETVQVSASSVRHVFTHCLINNPAKGCSTASGALDIDCLTVSEFEKLLQSLYDNNFVLIDINDMYVVDANGKAKLADSVTVPKGKKPLVISIDDVVYDPRKKDEGMIHRLVISSGTIMGEIDNADGTTTLTDGEVFPLLEKFLKTHPDFSYNGAKVTLALTGFAGILGYRTDEQYADQGIDVEKERQKAMVVVNWLKENGYNFACHSYSHANYTTCALSRVQRDVDMWNRNVKPLIGETKVFVYPYGAFTYYGTEKHDLLVENGFVMFCGTSQLNTVWNNKHPKNGGVASGTGSIYLERFTLTGQTLRMYGSKASFIDYYTNTLKYSEESALKAYDKYYATYRKNMEEYCIPENTYDHDNRYYKILPDT